MPDPKRLIREIHRRSLWQVLLIYAGASWVVFQIVQTLTEGLGLPSWFPAFALVLLLIGLPVVLATAFVQEGAPSQAEADPTLLPTAGPGEAGERSRVRDRARPHRLFTWRNAILGGILALALWGAVAGVWLLVVGPPRSSSHAAVGSSNAVAVLPFAYQGSDEYAYLGEGIVDLLSTKLDDAGELRSVDPRAVLSLVERDPTDLNPERGRQVARSLAAGLFVLGSIVEVGGRLTVSASLYDGRGGLDPTGEASAEGRAENVFETVDELAAELLANVGSGPATRVRRIAAVTTSSLPALKAYLEGEREYRLGQYQSAVDALERAVALDTAYALAYYRLSVVAEYSTLAERAQQAAEQAFRHAGRLSERDRRMLEAFRAWRRGAHREAERLYRSLVGSYPDEVEAWFELGEVLFHSNPFHGRSFTEAWEPFARVLRLDPDDPAPMYHMARIAAVEGRFSEMDSLIDRHNQLIEEGDRELEMLALRAAAQPGRYRLEPVLERLSRASDVTLALATWDVATWTDNVDGAVRLASLMAEPTRSVEVRTAGHTWLAHILLGKGRWEAANRELEQLAGLNPVAALEYQTLLTAFPFVSTDPSRLRDLRERLEAMDPHSVPPSGNPSVFYSAHDDLHPVLKEYLLGIVNVQLGEPERADAHATALERLPAQPKGGTVATDLAISIRAQLLYEQGRTQEALAMLDRIERQIWYNVALASPFYAQSFERFLRAELLYELGRYEEAAPWYAHSFQVGPYEMAYRPVAYLRLAEIHERQGDRNRAVKNYARFLELWTDADPELRSYVEAAQRAVEALSTDG